LTRHSNHPLSIQLFQSLENSKIYDVENFKETVGQGIEGDIHKHCVKIGSLFFIEFGSLPKSETRNPKSQGGSVFIEIDGIVKGSYHIKPNYRDGFETVLNYFKTKNKPVYLLSGDNDSERSFLQQFFNHDNLNFQQNPTNKLDFIKNLQSTGKKILMIGDGLNDAGALKQSDVGIVISENTNNFSPACDGILKSDKFKDLPSFLDLAKVGSTIVNRAYLIAFCYNIVGLSYAVSGNLQPVMAAILMPLSSVTIVLFGVLSGNYYARKLG
jgi:P-type Cu+ transporter